MIRPVQYPLTQFVAKVSPITGITHPLWCHLIDVGMVVEGMVLLAPRRICRGLQYTQGWSLADTAAWLAFNASLHDIGKAVPEFVHRIRTGCPYTGREFHAHITADQLMRRYPGDLGALQRGRVLGSHHGQFSPPHRVGAFSLSGGVTFQAHRDELIDSMAALFGVDPARALQAPLSPGDCMRLAAITRLGDRLASAWCPYAGTEAPVLAEYAVLARERALRWLSTTEWRDAGDDGVWRIHASAARSGTLAFALQGVQQREFHFCVLHRLADRVVRIEEPPHNLYEVALLSRLLDWLPELGSSVAMTPTVARALEDAVGSQDNTAWRRGLRERIPDPASDDPLAVRVCGSSQTLGGYDAEDES